MNLYKKIIFLIFFTTFYITFLNIFAIFFSVQYFLSSYVDDKEKSKISVTQEYLHDLIAKQTVEDIDNIFTDVDLKFVELVKENNGEIPLDTEENLNTVITYLTTHGVTAKYIQTLLPEKNLIDFIGNVGKRNTAEYNFAIKIIYTLLVVNILGIIILILLLKIFTRKFVKPIKKVTKQIQEISLSDLQLQTPLEYSGSKSDEIGLLIGAINSLKETLSVQHKIRSRLIADISHELKTPITSIQCYLEGMTEGIIEMNKTHMNSLTLEMNRLIKLVNQILDFERFDSQDLELNLEKNNIFEILKNIVETHKGSLKKNNQYIKITGENIFLNCDKDYFTQLSHNLIENFKKYSGPGSKLTINITKKYIDFCDDGVGIKSSKVPFLTEKFYQGESSKTGKSTSRGIGIGLSIVQKIIFSHMWKFQIKSEEKKGFSFKIFFN